MCVPVGSCDGMATRPGCTLPLAQMTAGLDSNDPVLVWKMDGLNLKYTFKKVQSTKEWKNQQKARKMHLVEHLVTNEIIWKLVWMKTRESTP